MGLPAEDVKIIFQVFTQIDQMLSDRSSGFCLKTNLTDSVLSQAKQAAYKHHLEHLRVLSVVQLRVDPYKIASWYGFYLNKIANDSSNSPAGDPSAACLLAAIGYMNNLLEHEVSGVSLDREWISFLYRYARNDGGKMDRHGVGKNGLYVAFATSRRILSIRRGCKPDQVFV